MLDFANLPLIMSTICYTDVPFVTDWRRRIVFIGVHVMQLSVCCVARAA